MVLYLSGNFHFNRFGFGPLCLWKVHFEYPILVLGIDFGSIGVFGKGKASHKAAVRSLDAVILLALFFLLVFPFATDGKDIVMDVDLDFLFISGISALITYSFSSSEMSTSGDHS